MVAKNALFAMMLAVLLAAGCATGSAPYGSVGDDDQDVTVAMKVKAALIDDADLAAAAIKVQADAGVVNLSGFVENEAQRRKAATVAMKVPGVQKVANDIVVK